MPVRVAPTTAAIADNDQLATGLMRGVTALGARVSADLSIVAFDHILPAHGIP
jgi:LacI family transcriptional regulator